MPRPVDALPWGSRSIIKTSSPIAASAVPRLIAVVVLPTPPFWLAMARTRKGCVTPTCRAGSAEDLATTLDNGETAGSDMVSQLMSDLTVRVMALGQGRES